MDDNLADYRRFCANRLQRLERCKKTKSFCNLEDEIPHSVAISCSDLITMESEIPVFPDSTILVTRCSETGTNTFCSRSPALPTDTSLSGSTKVSGIKIPSSAAKPNSAKLSPISGSWLANSRKCTANFIQIDNEGVNNRHLPQSSCSSPYSLYTIPSSTLSSTMSTKKPQLGMARGSMTVINNGNGCGDQGGQRNFDLLREKMISLMENDVRLLQQLLALGDSIQELKSRSQPHHCSRLSLDSLQEENDDDEEWCANDRIKSTLSDHSLSAITNLYVDDEPKENQSKQYFSRKNSVLRIPIPPRSSNRMSTNEKLHRRLSRLSKRCEQLSQQQQQQQQHEFVENSSQSRNDTMSRRSQGHSTIMISTYSSPYQTKSSSLRAPSTAVNLKQKFGTTDSRISSGSTDSGIRDESCSNSSADS